MFAVRGQERQNQRYLINRWRNVKKSKMRGRWTQARGRYDFPTILDEIQRKSGSFRAPFICLLDVLSTSSGVTHSNSFLKLQKLQTHFFLCPRVGLSPSPVLQQQTGSCSALRRDTWEESSSVSVFVCVPSRGTRLCQWCQPGTKWQWAQSDVPPGDEQKPSCAQEQTVLEAVEKPEITR